MHLSVSRLPDTTTESAGDGRSLVGCCPGLQPPAEQPRVQLPNSMSSVSPLMTPDASQVFLVHFPSSLVTLQGFGSSLVTLQGFGSLSKLYAVPEELLPPQKLVHLTC